MKNYDNEATIYLAGLSPALLRGTPRFLCFSIANRWSARFRCAVIPRQELCEELGIGERQFGRICQALQFKGIIEYVPGRGQGNYSQFRFPALDAKGVENATKPGHKGDGKPSQRRHQGDISDDAIRNINLSQDQPQKHDWKGLDFDSGSVLLERGDIAPSSSETQHDDSGEVSQIIRAFEASPITVGKANLADRATAKRLLRLFNVEEIEYGILLGSARKVISLANAEPFCGDIIGMAQSVSGVIQSLQYFNGAIEEAHSDDKCNGSYADYLESILEKFTRAKALGKKEPATATA